MGRSLGEGRLCRIGTGKWRLDYRDAASRRHRVVIHAHTKAEAEKERRKLLAMRDSELAGAASEDLMGLRLSEAAAPYLRHLETHARPSSIRCAKGAIKRLQEWIGDRPVRAITKSVVIQYREDRIRGKGLKKPIAPTTVNLQTTLLNAALNYAVRLGLLARNPVDGLRPLPEPEDARVRKRRALRPDELHRFLDAVRASDDALPSIAIPQQPLWSWLATCGTRWSETTALRWREVDLEARRITLRAPTTKGRRSRRIPIPRNLLSLFKNLRKQHGVFYGRLIRDLDPVFLCEDGTPWERRADSVRLRVLRGHLRAAGVDHDPIDGRGRVDVHALRATAATELLRQGVAPVAVARITGHRNIRTLLKSYEDLDDSDLESALDRAFQTPEPRNRETLRGSA